jgi:hypothetical protein
MVDADCIVAPVDERYAEDLIVIGSASELLVCDPPELPVARRLSLSRIRRPGCGERTHATPIRREICTFMGVISTRAGAMSTRAWVLLDTS